MDIWIDTTSGTWGDAASVHVVTGMTVEEVELLHGMSDEERSELGTTRGVAAVVYAAPWNKTVLAEIDQLFHERRVMIADEAPPNEAQEYMTEGLIYGLDIAQEMIHQALGD